MDTLRTTPRATLNGALNNKPAPINAALHALRLAQYSTVHNHPGSANDLGPLLHVNSKALCNQVNPHYAGAKLGVEDALLLQHYTGNLEMLEIMARALNCVVLPLPAADGTASDMELLNLYADWHVKLGCVAREISAALEDGKFEPAELERIRAEFFVQIRHGLAFLERLNSVLDAPHA